jgi:nitroimidazol reductase NimA-like FMN-containing flavoprotein (pyridoxamine 5'-phosphate oxidase superfamily)
VSAAAGPEIPTDLVAEVEGASRAFLVTRRGDGSPTVHPLTPIVRNGVIHFNTYRKSAKVKNLLRAPSVACVLSSADEATPYRAVECRGTAELLEASQIDRSLIHFGDASEVMSDEDLERVRRNMTSGKRVYLRIVPRVWSRCEPIVELDDRSRETNASETTDWGPTLAAAPIAMTADEAVAFLGEPRVAVLGTLDDEGMPRGRPARYTVGAGALDLVVAAGSPSLVDLAGDPRAAATVEEFPTYNTIRGVMVHGTAAPDPHAPTPAGFAGIRLRAERVLSFDFSKISASR